MFVWRVSNHLELTGYGGTLAHGRWHHKGRPILYCAETPAGALLEVLCHTEVDSINDLPQNLQLLQLEFDAKLLSKTSIKQPVRDIPLNETRELGSNWLEKSSSFAMRVPSVILPHTYNVLINPLHAKMTRCIIVSNALIDLDKRLFNFK